MSSLAELELRLEQLTAAAPIGTDAAEMLELAEEMLESWVRGRGEVPTTDKREGFRLLALHHQGARRLPSFNACRETCREILYYYNLLILQPEHPEARARSQMLVFLVNHLCLFIIGKSQVENLGEFCCASQPLRASGE